MHKLLVGFILLLSGGLLTSFAEFHFQYNLVGLVVEKVKGLFGKAKADISVEVKKL